MVRNIKRPFSCSFRLQKRSIDSKHKKELGDVFGRCCWESEGRIDSLLTSCSLCLYQHILTLMNAYITFFYLLLCHYILQNKVLKLWVEWFWIFPKGQGGYSPWLENEDGGSNRAGLTVSELGSGFRICDCLICIACKFEFGCVIYWIFSSLNVISLILFFFHSPPKYRIQNRQYVVGLM